LLDFVVTILITQVKDLALGMNSRPNDRFRGMSLCPESLFTVIFPPHPEQLERRDPLNSLYFYFKKLPGNIRDHMKRVFRSEISLTEMFDEEHRKAVYDTLQTMSRNHTMDFRSEQIEFTTHNPNEASWTDISKFPMVLIEILSFALGHYEKEDAKVYTCIVLIMRQV
jgi:hypothetical protein